MISKLQEYKLGGTAIFTHVAREMAKARRFAYVRSLLDSIAKVGYGDEDTVDEIVGACILIISNNHSEVTKDIVCLDLFCLLLINIVR